MRSPPETTVLGSDRILVHGLVTGADSVEWYTNAERINTNYRFYQILSTNDLKIIPLSPALSGIYQIVYRNKAGIVMRTVKVDIPNGASFYITLNYITLNYITLKSHNITLHYVTIHYLHYIT